MPAPKQPPPIKSSRKRAAAGGVKLARHAKPVDDATRVANFRRFRDANPEPKGEL